MASNEDQELQHLIIHIRDAFSKEQWDRTRELYDEVNAAKPNRTQRLEAACLAARALAATKHRPAARALLQPLIRLEYNKPVHYEFLARAFLDLKQYTDAKDACLKAESLRSAKAT